MISYSIATTPLNGSATTITITPPLTYTTGNLLVMTVTGGSTSGTAVSADTPSGWTALSTSGVSVFYKTAGSEPASYTVTMAATCSIAAYIAAYPAATIVSHSFGSSGTNATSYTTSYPSASSSQLVLVIAGAVASAGNAGYQNVVYPAGLNYEIPVFGQALPTQPGTVVYPCAVGLYDALGSVIAGLPTPVFTSPQVCDISVGFIVLTITGSVAKYSVTATVNYPEGTPGVVLAVKMISGATSAEYIFNNAAFNFTYGGGVSQAPSISLTPTASGSLVYGAVTANFAVSGTSAYTAASGTTFIQNTIDTPNEIIYGTFRGTSTTTANSAVTLGGSAPDNAYFTAAITEILAAGTLAETATATAVGLTPAGFETTSVSQTAVFLSPPTSGTLLVAIISANSRYTTGDANVTFTDSLGLVWYEQVSSMYPSYSGVWIASLNNVAVNLPTAQVTEAAHLLTTGAKTVALPVAQTSIASHTVGSSVGRSLPRAQVSEAGYPVIAITGAGVALPVARVNEASHSFASVVGPITLPVAQVSTAAHSITGPGTITLPVARVTSTAYTIAQAGSKNVSLAVAQGNVAAYAPTPETSHNAILDEAGNGILDEAGNQVYDESAPTGAVVVNLSVAQSTSTAYPPIIAAANAILDEAGGNVLDEAGNAILDESGGSVSVNAGNAVPGIAVPGIMVPGVPLEPSPGISVSLLTAQASITAYPLTPNTETDVDDILDEAGSDIDDELDDPILDEAGGGGGGTTGGIWEQTSPASIIGNNSYTVSAWVWTEQTNTTISIYWLAAGGVADGSATETMIIQPATWTFITLTATAPSTAVAAYPFLGISGADASFYAEHVTLVNASAEIPYLRSLGLDYDNTYLQNVTQATLTQGPNTLIAPVEKDQQSIASYLARGPQSVTVNGSSAQDAYDVAYWYLAKYKQPQLRASNITVDAATNPQSFSSILQFDLSDIAVVNRRPIGAPAYSLPVICEQVTHEIGPGVWNTSYQLSPYIQENTVLIPDGGADQDTLGSTTLAW